MKINEEKIKEILERGVTEVIDKEHLQPFVDALIKEKSIIQEGSKYIKK